MRRPFPSSPRGVLLVTKCPGSVVALRGWPEATEPSRTPPPYPSRMRLTAPVFRRRKPPIDWRT